MDIKELFPIIDLDASKLKYCYKYPRPAVTVDLIVVADNPNKAEDSHILLVRRGGEVEHGKLALPGGFLNMDETAADGALREFREETGAELPPDCDIDFFMVADKVDRDPRGRVISLVYTAIFDGMPFAVKGCDDAADALWLPLSSVTNDSLAFDHGDILHKFVDQHPWLHDKCPNCGYRDCYFCRSGN